MPPPHRHRPPHHHPPHHRPPHHHPPEHVPASAIAASIHPERLSDLLKPWIPDDEERAFVIRCIALEGPIHHRGASYVLLSLLGALLERLGPIDEAPTGDSIPVPLRLPPHLAAHGDDGHYPLSLPLGALERLAPRGSPELNALLDCLLDGPPHHALANAAMVCLLDALLTRLDERATRDKAAT